MTVTSESAYAPESLSTSTQTGVSTRLLARCGSLTTPTSSLSPTYIQANLLVLPSAYASDFQQFCLKNQVPIPLLGASSTPGSFSTFTSAFSAPLASDIDIRTDCPAYNVYAKGKLVEEGVKDIKHVWTDDHVAFLIGCSFSFESALCSHSPDLQPRHQAAARNVPMYRTSKLLDPVPPVFEQSHMVVSMRSYRRKDAEVIREITGRFGKTHGAPVDWGWDALERLGIKDLGRPDWGDVPVGWNAVQRRFEPSCKERQKEGDPAALTHGDASGDDKKGTPDEEVPFFWGCGVTPQEAIMQAGDKIEGTVMAHAPGHMLVLDIRDWDICAS